MPTILISRGGIVIGRVEITIKRLLLPSAGRLVRFAGKKQPRYAIPAKALDPVYPPVAVRVPGVHDRQVFGPGGYRRSAHRRRHHLGQHS